MNSVSAAHWLFFVALLFLVKEWVMWKLAIQSPVILSRLAALLVLLPTALLVSALALSGCGTAPSAVQTHPPVPAELLIPPAQPVLLTPGLGLKPPGPTRQSTPKAAQQTD